MKEQATWFVPSINPMNLSGLPTGLTFTIFDPANYSDPSLTAEQLQQKFAINVKALNGRFYDFCNFSPERLALHETMVGVATQLKTNGGPHYDEVVRDIYTHHVLPVIRNLATEFEQSDDALRHAARQAATAYFASETAASESPYFARLEALNTTFTHNLARYKKQAVELIRKGTHLEEDEQEELAGLRTTIGQMERDKEAIITELLVDSEILKANKGRIEEIVSGTEAGILSQEPVTSMYERLTCHSPDARKVLLIVGGGASGKESITIRLELSLEDPNDIIELNPDRYKRSLPPAHEMADNEKWLGSLTHNESSIVFNNIARRWQAMAESGTAPNILVNVTRADWVQDIVQTGGVPVEIHTPVLPVEKALIRSHYRGELTGRFMPTEPLIQGHKDQPSTVLNQMKAGTCVTLYNTNVDYDTSPMELSVVARYSGDERLLRIYDMGAMYDYFTKGELNPQATSHQDLRNDTSATTAAAMLRYAKKMTIEMLDGEHGSQMAELRAEAGRPVFNITDWSALERQMGEMPAYRMLYGLIQQDVEVTGGKEIEPLIADINDTLAESAPDWQTQVASDRAASRHIR